MSQQRNFIRGITLLEILLSLFLSIGLFAILITIYLTTVKNAAIQAAYYSIQQNSQLALQILARDIHSAGYIGCGRLTEDFPVQTYLHYSLRPNNKIIGEDSAITVRSASTESAYLPLSMDSLQVLFVSLDAHFSRQDVVIVSDCESAEIFQIKSIESAGENQQKIITQMPLHKHYAQYAEVSKLEENHYVVADTKRVDSTGKIIKALFRRYASGHNLELVEGVQQLQFEYDVLRNNSIVRVHANAVTDWATVVGVAMAVTVHAMSAYPLQKMEYGYAALSS